VFRLWFIERVRKIKKSKCKSQKVKSQNAKVPAILCTYHLHSGNAKTAKNRKEREDSLTIQNDTAFKKEREQILNFFHGFQFIRPAPN